MFFIFRVFWRREFALDTSRFAIRAWGWYASAALKDRCKREACVRRDREDHGIARRANVLLLLDDGESCTQIAKYLYLDDDTVRGLYKAYKRESR